MANLTLAELRARLSPRAALAVAARDAAVPAPRAVRREAAKRAQTAHKAALKLAVMNLCPGASARRGKAPRDADLPRFHAAAKRYRESHPATEPARVRRWCVGKRTLLARPRKNAPRSPKHSRSPSAPCSKAWRSALQPKVPCAIAVAGGSPWQNSWRVLQPQV
jgi:hypothetical protein